MPTRMAQMQIYEDQAEDPELASDAAAQLGEEEEETESARDSDEEDAIMTDKVREELAQFQETFKDIRKRYKLLGKIGEGTFSTVYKAEDLQYDKYQNDWDIEEKERVKWSPHSKRLLQKRRGPRYVAIKKIYVTSSPWRICNELQLLHDLRKSDSICPLITACRHQDQVIAVLPYFQHADFREYYRDFKISDMRLYLRSLLTALESVHAKGILHRDIKPTNFLYSPKHSRGVLVDFGLAERKGTDWHLCFCELPTKERQRRLTNCTNYTTIADQGGQSSNGRPGDAPSYPGTDNRHSRRANRAGTRGFRAPEVLFKCTAQTPAIDMWSVGIMLLTLLTRRFPFFHSTDDIDAILELCAVLGKRKLRTAALQHGQVFECNIPSYPENGHSFERVILWCAGRAGKDSKGQYTNPLNADEREAVAFLGKMLECNHQNRITAAEALRHPFIIDAGKMDEDEDMVDLVQ